MSISISRLEEPFKRNLGFPIQFKFFNRNPVIVARKLSHSMLLGPRTKAKLPGFLQKRLVVEYDILQYIGLQDSMV